MRTVRPTFTDPAVVVVAPVVLVALGVSQVATPPW
jgi:hypothetical protein